MIIFAFTTLVVLIELFQHFGLNAGWPIGIAVVLDLIASQAYLKAAKPIEAIEDRFSEVLEGQEKIVALLKGLGAEPPDEEEGNWNEVY